MTGGNVADDGNGRVTLAVLAHKVDELCRSHEKLAEMLQRTSAAYDQRISALESQAAVHDERFRSMCSDIEAVSRTAGIRDALVAFASAVAAAIGISVK